MNIICKVLAVVLWVNPALAHSSDKPNTFEFKLHIESKRLNESRPFHIQLPKNYYQNKQQNFPVLYVLDGDNLQHSATFTQKFLASKQHVPERIIVSVPHTGERTRDFSPYFRYSQKVNLGVNNLLSFIKDELIPLVDKQYRTSDYRILAGHSKSGLFVIHSLIQEPKLFRAHFAFSPSLHHTPKMQQDIERFLKNSSEVNSYLYVNVGGSEFFKIKDAINLAKDSFRELSPKGLRHRFELSDLDGHQTTPQIGFHLAFKNLYKPHKLDFGYSDMSFTEVIQHFENTSKEFGYVVKPNVKELQSMQRYYFSIEPGVETLSKIHLIMEHYYPSEKLVDNNSRFYIQWLTNGAQSGFTYPPNAYPDEGVLHKVAHSYAVESQFTDALFAIDLALSIYPKSYKSFEYKAKLLEKMGNQARALKAYKQALELADNQDSQQRELYMNKIVQLQASTTDER